MLRSLLPPPARLRALGAALILLGLTAFGATAQTQAASPTAASNSAPAANPDDVKRLLAALNDPTARARLIGELTALVAAEHNAAPAPPTPAPSGPTTPSDWVARMLAQISDGMATITADIAETGQTAREWRRATDWLGALLHDPTARADAIELLMRLVIVAIGAIASEWLVALLIARPRRSFEQWSATSPLGRWLLLLARVILALVPIAAFIGAAYLILPLTMPDRTTRLVAIALINANVLVRVVFAIARRVLLPNVGRDTPAPRQRRLLPLDDPAARSTYRWLRSLARVGIYGFFLASAMAVLGISAGARDLLLRAIGLIVTAMLIALILPNRAAVARRIAGAARPSETRLDEWHLIRVRFAEIWHVLAVCYVVGAFLVWALAINHGFAFLALATIWTTVTLVLLRLGLAALRWLTARINRGSGAGAETDRPARLKALLPLVSRVVRSLLFVVAALSIAQAWGVDVRGALASPIGQRVLTSGFSIAVILGVAVAAWEIAALAIARSLTFGDALDVQRGSARLRTLLPLLRNALSVLIVVLTTLVVLSELGINIAPLLAGAGVVGLAIGFGAQTLVKDVITGLFFLLEDTVNVGDVVDVGGHSGFVESMSIRSIRLRDVEGSVHTVPFSAVAAIKNMTKDFGYSVHDVLVDYRSDLQRAIAVIGEADAELRADRTYGAMITTPVEIMGVEKFADNAVVVRCRIKTLPAQRWAVGREFNRRLKLAFDRAGIGMVAAVPPPEPTPPPEPVTAELPARAH